MTKHVLTRPASKTAEVALDGPRAVLADAISENESAQRAADAADEALRHARDRLRKAETAHASARDELDAAQAPPSKPLAEKLAGVRGGSDEYFRILEAHEAEPPRQVVTLEDLKRMRQGVADTEDVVTIERNAVEFAEVQARLATSALNRAKDRRQKAIHEVVRPEVGRLMGEVQDLVERLGAKRAELSFVANSLINSLEDDRRQATYLLSREFFPEEGGLRSPNDLTRRNAALGALAEFAEAITKDAAVPFPGSD